MALSKIYLVRLIRWSGEFFIGHLQRQQSYNYVNFDCFVINLLCSSCSRNLVDSHYIWLVFWWNYFDLIWWCLHSRLRAHVVCTSVSECLCFYMYMHANACLHASPFGCVCMHMCGVCSMHMSPPWRCLCTPPGSSWPPPFIAKKPSILCE